MSTTIDNAGRVVIPAALRRQAGLKPSTPLAVTYEDGAIRIERDVAAPKIQQRGKRRVATPAKQGTSLNLAAWIEEERDRWPL